MSPESRETRSGNVVKMDKMMLVPVARYKRLQQRLQTGEGVEEEVEEGEEGLSDDVILQAMAKNHKTKARALLGHIRNDGGLTWNQKGEIVYGGVKVAGSHITDLVKDTMRPYSNFTPMGREVFYRALADMNIPRGLINRQGGVLDVEVYKRRKAGPPGMRQNNAWISL